MPRIDARGKRTPLIDSRCRRLLAVLPFAVAAVALLAGSSYGRAAATAKPPIVIGVLEDTSGGAAAYSQVGSATIRVAASEINRQGGIFGRQVKLVFESDGNSPSLAPTVVRHLVDQGAIAVITNSGSASAVQAKPVLKELQRVGISALNLDTRIGNPPDVDYSFMVVPGITAIGQLYGIAFKRLGITKLALLGDNSPTIAGLTNTLVPLMQKGGVTVVAQETAALDATDVTPQVLRIQAQNPDAILTPSLGGQLEIVMHRTISRLMPKTQQFSLASIGNQPTTWDLASSSDLDGLVYIASLTDRNPRTVALAKLLKAKLGVTFLTAYHAQAWDAMMLLRTAIIKAGTANDSVKLRDALEKIQGYRPAFGQPAFRLSFGPNRHFASAGVCGFVLGTFKGNKPGPAWTKYQPRCR